MVSLFQATWYYAIFVFWALPTDEWKVSDFPSNFIPLFEALPPISKLNREA